MKLIEHSNIPDSDMATGDWMRSMGDKGKLKGLGIVRDVINQRIMKKDKTGK